LSDDNIAFMVDLFDRATEPARAANAARIARQRAKKATAQGTPLQAQAALDFGEPPKAKAKKTPRPRAIGVICPDTWFPKERHYEFAVKLGHDVVWVKDSADEMRDWSLANAHRDVARKSNWDRAFFNWMRKRHAERNGQGPAGRRDDPRSATHAARRLKEHFGRLADEAGEPPLEEILRGTG